MPVARWGEFAKCEKASPILLDFGGRKANMSGLHRVPALSGGRQIVFNYFWERLICSLKPWSVQKSILAS